MGSWLQAGRESAGATKSHTKSNSDSDGSVFRNGSSSTCTNRVKKVAGSVVRARAGEFLGREPYIGRLRTDAGIPEQHLHGRHSIKDVEIKTAQEMRTSALAMDALTSGYLMDVKYVLSV